MTRNAPTFDQVWHQIEPFISGQNVVAHNGFRFDFLVLNKTLEYYKIFTPIYEKHCTYHIYKKGLAFLCQQYNIALNHHDALSDSKACAELFKMHLGNGIKIKVQDYFEKGPFTIPKYQQGYKWTIKDGDKESSLELFLSSLINAYESNISEYGIGTLKIVEKDDQLILVDGQQRTTSLFLIFIVLKEFDLIYRKIHYKVKGDAHNWLNNISKKGKIIDEEVHDIIAFNEAIEQINKKIENIFDKRAFTKFIKEKVFLDYNTISKEFEILKDNKVDKVWNIDNIHELN